MVDYKWCREIQVSDPGNNIQGYSFKLRVFKDSGGAEDPSSNQIDCNGLCDNWPYDIRFASSPMWPYSGQLLPQWYDHFITGSPSPGLAYVDIWVTLSLPHPENKRFYMLIGNPDAELYSDGDATFQFFDDFDTDPTESWNFVSVSTYYWDSDSNTLTVYVDSGNADGGIVSKSSWNISSIMAEGYIRAESPWGAAGYGDVRIAFLNTDTPTGDDWTGPGSDSPNIDLGDAATDTDRSKLGYENNYISFSNHTFTTDYTHFQFAPSSNGQWAWLKSYYNGVEESQSGSWSVSNFDKHLAFIARNAPGDLYERGFTLQTVFIRKYADPAPTISSFGPWTFRLKEISYNLNASLCATVLSPYHIQTQALKYNQSVDYALSVSLEIPPRSKYNLQIKGASFTAEYICSRWDEDNWNVTIEIVANKETRDTLLGNITPGAVAELYTILGEPKFIDTTFSSGNTIWIIPKVKSGLIYLREPTKIAVKRYSETMLRWDLFKIKIEGVRL